MCLAPTTCYIYMYAFTRSPQTNLPPMSSKQLWRRMSKRRTRLPLTYKSLKMTVRRYVKDYQVQTACVFRISTLQSPSHKRTPSSSKSPYKHTSIIRASPASWLLILLNVLDALLVVSRECPIVLILNITDACHTLRPERRGFVVVSLSTNLAV